MTELDPNDLPAFRAWRTQYEPELNAASYLSEHLTVTTARLFADVIIPELVEVRGCVILKSRYEPENFEEWWSHQGGDKVAVEGIINRLVLWDMFEAADDYEERALRDLATRIASTWRLHAEQCFPGRRFVTTVTDDYGPTVVMTSAPPSPGAPVGG